LSDPIVTVHAALTTALHMFEHGSRRTGRTEAMIAQLKPGHRVIVPDERYASFLRRELRERGIADVIVVGCDPKSSLPNHPRTAMTRMPTTADHTWITARFLSAIDHEAGAIRRELDHIGGVHAGMPRWPAEWPPGPDWEPPEYAPDEVDASSWNWWEIVSRWASGEPAKERSAGPWKPRAILPFVLPIVMDPPTARHDRQACAAVMSS
jgi:hypothetical protein